MSRSPAARDATLLTLVRLAYEAAANPDAWPLFLEQYRQAVDAASTPLLVLDRRTFTNSISSQGHLPDEAMQLYHSYYAALNPHIRRRLHELRPGALTLSHQRYPIEQLVKTEYYNDFAKPFDAECVMSAWFAGRDEGTRAHISALRPIRAGLFGEREVSVLAPLMPHLQLAVRIHLHLRGLRLDARATEDALEHLAIGVMVVSGDGHVLMANARARRAFDGRDGLRNAPDGLHAANRNESNALRSAIARAARTGMGESLAPGGIVRLTRTSGRGPLTVMVANTLRMMNGSPLPRGCVTLVLREAEESAGTAEMLARRYGLTATEGRVAERLLCGDAVSDMSALFGLTADAVRWHVKGVLHKSGAKRQTDFVRTASRSPASYVTGDARR